MSQRSSSNFLPRSPASIALIAAQRAAITRKANREAQRLRDEALVTESLNRVWMDENKKRRRKESTAEQPPAVKKGPHKRAKVLPSRAPKYDDIEDDTPTSDVLPPRSANKNAVIAPEAAANIVKHGDQERSRKKAEQQAAQPQGNQGRTRKSRDRDDWAADAVGVSDLDDDNGPEYATDGDQEEPRARDSGSESNFEPEEDELYDPTAYDQPRWTPVRDSIDAEDDLTVLCDSDPELEYVRTHGLTALTRTKSYTDVSKLFATDEGVTDTRATGPKLSKREQKRRSEEATWQRPDANKVGPANSANEQARGAHASEGQQAQKAVPSLSAQPTHLPQRNTPISAWSASTAIAVTSHGNLALNQSSADVRKVFHRAEEEMKLSVVTQNAYEDVDARSKIHFLTNTLTVAAWNSECPEIDNRLCEDSGYARVLAEALSTRMSQFRGRFRTSAAARVAAYFGLNNGGDPARWVEDLLERKRYIYPVGLSENAARARPYENSILTDVVQDVLITRNRNFIKDNVDMFKVNVLTT
ncbi:hypothetical protein BC629DRAFT_1596706 [Irpex lacteus]|nr:hypothetical protein BC629DRAFT_1596706 [Irpex lacteus]